MESGKKKGPLTKRRQEFMAFADSSSLKKEVVSVVITGLFHIYMS